MYENEDYTSQNTNENSDSNRNNGTDSTVGTDGAAGAEGFAADSTNGGMNSTMGADGVNSTADSMVNGEYRFTGPFHQDNDPVSNAGTAQAGSGSAGSMYGGPAGSTYGSAANSGTAGTTYGSTANTGTAGNTYGSPAGGSTSGTSYGSYASYSTYSAPEPPTKKKKREKKEKDGKPGFGKRLLCAICLALVFGLVAGAAFVGTNYAGSRLMGGSGSGTDITASEDTANDGAASDANSSDDTSAETTLPSSTVSNKGSMDVSAIVSEAMPSLVAITNVSVTEIQNYWGYGWYNQPQTQESTSTGTGIIIGQNDTELLIVTNYHVISGATSLTVFFSVDEGNDEASAVEAVVKGSDSEKDVAVIAVKLEDIDAATLSQIKAATIGDSSSMKVGQQVVAIGNALGYGQSVTTGIVSAVNRTVTLQYDDGTTISNALIQTDAAINPGNSGGALLNMDGELIGINEAKLSSNYVEGMGYAIPISDVEGIIGDLKNIQTRDAVSTDNMGYLGITCQDVTDDIASQYDMPVGVYLKSVIEGCGAEKAGLRKGDILTRFDGVSISSYDALKDRLQYYAAGETVEVTVQRSENGTYEEVTVNLTLSSKQEVETASAASQGN